MTPEEFGDLIRAHREAKGLGIEELASRFKLSLSAIRAIERGSLSDLPHAVYARGFIRAYAQAVEVSPEELSAGLAALFPDETFAEGPSTPRYAGNSPTMPFNRRNRSFTGVFVALIVLVLFGGAGWLAYSNFDTVKDFVAQPFSALTQPSGDDDAPSPPSPETSVAEPVPAPVLPAPDVSFAGQVPPQDVQDAPVAPAPAIQLAAAVEAPAANTAGQTEVAPAAPVSGNHIVVLAKEECWMQVSADGEGTRTFTVYPGESSILPYKRRLTLVLGNAGGVSITHNGKAYPVSGRRNEKKTFSFQ